MSESQNEAPPNSISHLTPELSQKLKQHFEIALSDTIQKIGVSRFATESPSLLAYRNCLPNDESDKVEVFRNTVPLSTYAAYDPFIQKLLEQPCSKQLEVENLLAPGYPLFVAPTSATTGKTLRYIPKYVMANVNPQEGILATNKYACFLMHLGTKGTITVKKDETGAVVTKFPLTQVSAGMARFKMGLGRDENFMGIKVPYLTSPLAVSFINNYRSFLLMHALFALGERHLEIMYTTFGTIYIDFITLMEEEWDKLLNSIETGILPDFDDTEHVRSYLQQHFIANPDRAKELRSAKPMKESPGWLKKIWPDVKECTGIMSGVYSGVLSRMQSYFGPDVKLRSAGYVLSECWTGITYNNAINLYKLAGDDYYEFLPTSQSEISEEESAEHLVPVWKVQTGKTYEPVVTTHNGLWRYRSEDMVKIMGFELTNGFPIISFVQRRQDEIRLTDDMVHTRLPGTVLTNAIFSTTEDTIGRVVEFTSYLDTRPEVPTVGYVVELDGDIGPNPALARQQVLEVLRAQHVNIPRLIDTNKMSLPTIRVVKHGAFADYRHWRVESLGISVTQVKVPTVIKDETLLERLLKGIVYEA
ncbi:hypothetical protein Clacol_004802 [Clathrus columnatus]|uniref:GH3 auxin-responsive promoter n=1 Tax=Clathrus columnatus TaxID=1419009 RepID=A0AAV5A8F8_9AGAM|nr:hypothetical protein Clacol_004802 [Clathrus columnatus]